MNRPRAAVLTSTSPRHRYFAGVAANHFEVVAVLAQPKVDYYDSRLRESALVRQHFARNREAEEAEFSAHLPAPEPVQVADINSPDALRLARRVDLVLLFGTAILRTPWLDAFPRRIINLHLGLSPFYRGSATLFWPMAERALACVGATIHLAADKVDAGDILRRLRAEPRPGDSYYTLTNRLIRHAIDAVPDVAQAYLEGRLIPVPQGTPRGRAFRKADFDEAALLRMLAFVGEGITEEMIAEARRSGRCDFSQ